MRRTRIRLLPKDPHRTEIQKDALKAIECSLGLRGLHRPGDVVEIPLTNSHMQRMLRRTKSRRSGNHYARLCLKELVAMNVIEDTGRTLKPLKQPSRQNLRWWKVYKVIPILRALQPAASLPSWVTGSLLSFLRCQGLIAKLDRRKRFQKGSVQEAFAMLGPP